MSIKSSLNKKKNLLADNGPGNDTEHYDGGEHLASYREHSNTLRAWLVAYGVGGPVLILSQDSLWTVFAKSGLLPIIAASFLVGVSIQVGLAAVNKSVMWAIYYGSDNDIFQKTRRFKSAICLSKQYWIDLFSDLISIMCFVYATYMSFIALVSSLAPN